METPQIALSPCPGEDGGSDAGEWSHNERLAVPETRSAHDRECQPDAWIEIHSTGHRIHWG